MAMMMLVETTAKLQCGLFELNERGYLFVCGCLVCDADTNMNINVKK